MVSLVLICGIGVHALLPAHAADLGDLGLTNTARDAGLTSNTAPTGGIQIGYFVGQMIEVVLQVLGLAFFVLIFYSGIRWMTAEGNEEIVQKAKDSLTQAVWGFSIVATAYILTSFIVSRVGEALN